MTFLTYLLAFFLFIIGSLIANTLYLTIWSILNALLKKPYNNSGMDQFIGAILGGFFGTIFCLYAFNWMEKDYNIYIIVVINIIVWLLSHLELQLIYFPNLQRIGGVIGILLSLLFYDKLS